MVLANAAYDNRDVKLAAERLDKVPVEQRGWEWHYLKRQLHGGIFTLYGHKGPVTSVAFSPDGTRIVTGAGNQGEPFEAKVWDARTGMLLFDLKGLPPSLEGINIPVVNVAFSTDSKRIVTAGGNKTARVYDATTGALQLELTEPKAQMIECAAFSPDGTRIATLYRSGLKLSDARTGKALLEWSPGDGSRLAFSADGTRILTGGLGSAVKVWDARTGTLLLDAKGIMSDESDVAFSPDGNRIVAGRMDGTARVIDARTGGSLLELKGHPLVANTFYMMNGVLCVAYSPDGTRIVTGGSTDSGSGEASVFDARTGAELLQLKGHTSRVMSAAFSPDGQRIITGSADGTVKVWDARTGTPRLELEGIKTPIASAALSPDGTWIVTGGSFNLLPAVAAGRDRRGVGEATVWDARTGMPKFALQGLKGRVNSVAVSKDGTRIATVGGDTGPPAVNKPAEVVAFSQDGMEVALPSGDRTVRVWDARTGAPLIELKGNNQRVDSVAFSPDGSRIVTAGGQKLSVQGGPPRAEELRVWDVATGAVLFDVPEKPQPGMTMARAVPVWRSARTAGASSSAGCAPWTAPRTWRKCGTPGRERSSSN